MPLTVCPRCSSFVSDGASFCPACGLSLRNIGSPQASPAPPQDGPPTPPANPPSESGFLHRHRGMLSAVTVVGAVVFVLGVTLRHRIESVLNPPLTVLSVSPLRDALPASGGMVKVSARVSHATKCVFALVRHPSGIGVSLRHDAGRCSSGNYSADVVIGQNPFQHGQQIPLSFVARRGVHSSPVHRILLTIEPSVSAPSSNWAGYIHPSGRPLTGVSATWTVPLLHCATGNGGLAAWVGVDGHAELNRTFEPNNNLFQAGSESACVNGQQYDGMWWEWYPVNLSNPVLAVNPGDSVTASLVREHFNGQYGWWWVVTDHTTGQSQSAQAPVPYDGPAAAADFIVEDPGTFGRGNAKQPFVGFTPITFSKMLETTDNPPSYAPFSFDAFDPTGVVDMIRQSHEGVRTLVSGALPAETPYGYGTMTVTYVGP